MMIRLKRHLSTYLMVMGDGDVKVAITSITQQAIVRVGQFFEPLAVSWCVLHDESR